MRSLHPSVLAALLLPQAYSFSLSQQHHTSSASFVRNSGFRRSPSSSSALFSERILLTDSDNEELPKDTQSQAPQGFVSGGLGQSSARLGKAAPTVWTEFARIAQENDNVVNLGQGFPDWLPPQFAIDNLVEAVQDEAQSPHQYTRPAGHPSLVKELGTRYSQHLQRDVDPMTEIAVTVGASQALYLCLQAIAGPGDEVILFEPFFDLYVNQVKLAGATPVFVPLRFVPYEQDVDASETSITPGEWVLDEETLQKAVNQNTKAIILNSPHNPTGKIFTRTEMEYVAGALEMANPDCVVISDEVYKYIVHSPPKDSTEDSCLHCLGHVHFGSLPGMWDRSITVSSAGKTFSATGWQVGWCVGPSHLIGRIHQLLPYVQFCASTVMQEALARSLRSADLPFEGYDSYYDYLRMTYTRKRDLLADALSTAGFAVPDYNKTPGGGFFIFARIGPEIRNQIPPERLNARNPAAPTGVARDDWALCQWMAEEKGVLCIPSAPFFSQERVAEGASNDFIRVAFCKSDATIQAAHIALSTVVDTSEFLSPVTAAIPTNSSIVDAD